MSNHNKRWCNAGLIGNPEQTRRVGFTGKATEFHRKYSKSLYITNSVKASTVFVDYAEKNSEDNKIDLMYIVDSKLATYIVSPIGIFGRIFAHLMHQLACSNCKNQLILLDGILACTKCGEIK